VWERLPGRCQDAPFVGNGLLGTIVFLDDQQTNSLRFEIGRSDVFDHRDRTFIPPEWVEETKLEQSMWQLLVGLAPILVFVPARAALAQPAKCLIAERGRSDYIIRLQQGLHADRRAGRVTMDIPLLMELSPLLRSVKCPG
jgi:hypothetical protein